MSTGLVILLVVVLALLATFLGSAAAGRIGYAAGCAASAGSTVARTKQHARPVVIAVLLLQTTAWPVLAQPREGTSAGVSHPEANRTENPDTGRIDTSITVQPPPGGLNAPVSGKPAIKAGPSPTPPRQSPTQSVPAPVIRNAIGIPVTTPNPGRNAGIYRCDASPIGAISILRPRCFQFSPEIRLFRI